MQIKELKHKKEKKKKITIKKKIHIILQYCYKSYNYYFTITILLLQKVIKKLKKDLKGLSLEDPKGLSLKDPKGLLLKDSRIFLVRDLIITEKFFNQEGAQLSS